MQAFSKAFHMTTGQSRDKPLPRNCFIQRQEDQDRQGVILSSFFYLWQMMNTCGKETSVEDTQEHGDKEADGENS